MSRCLKGVVSIEFYSPIQNRDSLLKKKVIQDGGLWLSFRLRIALLRAWVMGRQSGLGPSPWWRLTSSSGVRFLIRPPIRTQPLWFGSAWCSSRARSRSSLFPLEKSNDGLTPSRQQFYASLFPIIASAVVQAVAQLPTRYCCVSWWKALRVIFQSLFESRPFHLTRIATDSQSFN